MNTSLPNYELIRTFYLDLLEKNISQEDVLLITETLEEEILKITWTVLYANAGSDLQNKLQSEDKKLKDETAMNIIQLGMENPLVKKELHDLIQNVLLDIKNSI